MAEGLLDKANIILTPTGYKAGTMYNVAPIEQPYEDFDFARASVASRVNSSGLVEMVGRTLGSNLVQNGDFSEIGPDLVQNGTFDLGSELNDLTWSAFGGWSIVDGVASNDGSGSTIVNEILEIGKTYKITIQLSTYTSGNFSVFLGSGTESSQFNGTDEFTFYGVCSGDAYARVKSYSGIGSINIQNVSVKEVPDWTVTDSDANNYVEFTDGFARLKFLNTSPITMLNSSLTLQANKNYKLIVDVHDVTSGAIKIDSAGMSELFNTEGVTTRYLNPTGNTSLTFYRATADVDITLASVSVQELDPNDYWILGTGWSIGDGKATSNASANSYLNQSVYTIGNTYKLTFEVLEGTIELRSAHYSSGVGYYATGTHTVYVIPTTADTNFYVYTGFGQTSITNIVVQEVIDTNNIPRINYDSNGENGHWLLEPTSTNILPYSEDFSNVTENALTVTDNVTTSPQGLSNAASIIPNNTNTVHYLSYPNNTTGTVTFSIYAKSNGYNFIFLHLYDGSNGRAWFNLENGQVETTDASITSKIESVGSGWYRCIITRVLTGSLIQADIAVSNADNTVVFPGDGTSGVYIWGAQLEALPYATSYIPTLTGSTETRATETANGAGSADLINSTEGVLYAEIAALSNDGTTRRISLSDGSISNRVSLELDETSNKIKAFISNGGVSQILEYTASDLTQYNKIAIKYKANDFALWLGGVERDTDTLGSVPIGLNTLEFAQGSGVQNFYGKCKELAVFGEALSDDELEKLTSWSSFNAMATDLGYTIE